MILSNCRLVLELCEQVSNTMVDIRIEGDTIVEFLPVGGKYIGDVVIDCNGKTVLPGLFNLHVHLIADDYANLGKNENDSIVYALKAINYAQDMLCYGYTNVRDVGSAYNVSIKIRNMINASQIVGPRITACGYILTPTMPNDFILYSHMSGRSLDNPENIRKEVRRQIAEGADFIKIYGCRFWGVTGDKGAVFYPDEMAELCNTIAREGSYLAVHTIDPESNRDAIEAEAHTIEHGHQWTQENMDLLIAHNYKTNIVPTISIMWDAGARERCYEWSKGLQMPYDAGVTLGFGTDSSHSQFVKAPGREFMSRSAVLGWSNIELLKQATINSAKILGIDEKYGTIKVGKRADLVVFDGNPDEDLTLFNNPCAYVIKDGKLVAKNGMIKSRCEL